MFTIVRAKTLRALEAECWKTDELTVRTMERWGEALQADKMALEARIEAARAAAGGDTNRPSVRRMLAALDGETVEAPKPKVDAGPVPTAGGGKPDWDVLEYRYGKRKLSMAFAWSYSKQGHDYWEARRGLTYTQLDPEARAIIDAWRAELEASS